MKPYELDLNIVMQEIVKPLIIALRDLILYPKLMSIQFDVFTIHSDYLTVMLFRTTKCNRVTVRRHVLKIT